MTFAKICVTHITDIAAVRKYGFPFKLAENEEPLRIHFCTAYACFPWTASASYAMVPALRRPASEECSISRDLGHSRLRKAKRDVHMVTRNVWGADPTMTKQKASKMQSDGDKNGDYTGKGSGVAQAQSDGDQNASSAGGSPHKTSSIAAWPCIGKSFAAGSALARVSQPLLGHCVAVHASSEIQNVVMSWLR